MQRLRRALLLGLGFGLAAATLEMWANLLPFMERRMGPGPLFVARVAVLEIALGALLGLLAAPLLRLRRGTLLHVLAMALAWYGLERWARLDSPLFAPAEILRPGGGALLTLLGLWIARARARLPWAIGAALLLAGIAAPFVYLRATTPPQPPRAELPPAKPGAPNVVLVVLDTVRAHNVATYGYARPTSPELDRLAAEGALFLDATSPSTWSLPSHASLFTGVYPSSHGAHGEHPYLDDRYPTLAQMLEHHGYETFCITANPWISDGLGLTRGFGWQDTSLRNQGGAGRGFSFVHRLLDRLGLEGGGDKGGSDVAASFEGWARKRVANGGRPSFVFLNFIEAHFPYHVLPSASLRLFTDLAYGKLRAISMDLMGQQFGGKGRPVAEAAGPAIDMYDGGIAYSNELLHRVVEALRSNGTLDRTVLVVLADHGEILGERGGYFGHGPSLYQEVVSVPLLVRYPPRIPAGARVATPVSTVGVFATIADLAGLAPPPTLQVASLAPLARGEARDGGGPILSELHLSRELGATQPDPQMKGDRRYRLLREGALKLVASSKGESFVYDLAADPGETRDLAAGQPETVAKLRARMQEVEQALALPALDAEAAAGAGRPELDPATRERLRALGYAD